MDEDVDLISQEYRDKLLFLRRYFFYLEEGKKFVSDQYSLREAAALEASGYGVGDEFAQDSLAELEIFSLEIEEAFRAQMIVIIWSYLESLVVSAIKSIGLYHKKRIKIEKKKGESLVDSWRYYFENSSNFELGLQAEDWDKLGYILAVRNFIAHSTHRPGYPPKNKQKEAVDRIPGIRLAPDGLAVSKNCIEALFNFSEKILMKMEGEHWLNSEAIDL